MATKTDNKCKGCDRSGEECLGCTSDLDASELLEIFLGEKSEEEQIQFFVEILKVGPQDAADLLTSFLGKRTESEQVEFFERLLEKEGLGPIDIE